VSEFADLRLGITISDELSQALERLDRLMKPLRWSIDLGPIHIWHYDGHTRGPISLWKWGVRVRHHGVNVG
jgi:hypothetical protein